MKLKIKAGTTGRLIRIFVQDSSQTNGAPLTGLTNSTPGLTWYYSRIGDTGSTAVALAAGTVGTWSTGTIAAVDGTNMPGVYELGVPNAALAAGATAVHMMLRGATNMVPVPIEIELDAVDYQNATSFGLTNLANAVSTTAQIATSILTDTTSGDLAVAGSLGHLVTTAPSWYTAPPSTAAISTAVLTDTNAGDLSSAGSLGYLIGHAPSWYTTPPTTASIATAVLTDTSAGDLSSSGSLGYLIGHAPSWYTAPTTPPTTAQISTAIWQDLTSSADFTTAGSIGKLIVTNLDTNVGSRLATSGYTAPPTTAQIAAAILVTPANLLATDASGHVALQPSGLDAVLLEGTINARQGLALAMDAVCSLLSGAATTTVTITDPSGVHTRIVATVDSSGNRTAVTLTPP